MTDNRPVVSNRDKLLSVSVFPHTDENGKTTYGMSLQRAYQTKEQKGTQEFSRQKISIYPDEALKLAALLVRTYNDTLVYVQMNKQSSGYPAQAMDSDDVPPVEEDDIPY